MPEYLVGFTYHEPEPYALWQRGLIEDFESSTGLWVMAETPAEAVAWGERVAQALQRQVNGDLAADWAGAGHSAWVEESPATSGWRHCLGFFPRVRAGEMPPLDRIGTEAYRRWQEQGAAEPGAEPESSAADNAVRNDVRSTGRLAVRPSMSLFSSGTVARVCVAVLATCAFLGFGYLFLNAMKNREWLRAVACVTISLAAIPWASHHTDARKCLRASVATSIGALSGVAMVLLYFLMFDFDWFERIFNDKGTGPLGMFLFASMGFAGGGYACWRLLASTRRPRNGSMTESPGEQPRGEPYEAQEGSASASEHLPSRRART